MAWSTQQLADLAETTVKAVRYYHKIGLLDVPERTANGYKQYEVSHLVRLLQIKRLSDLGVPLSEVASMGRADEDPDEEFEALPADADDAAIDRLAARMLPVVRRSRERNPWSRDPAADAPRGAKHAEHTMAEAMVQLYNPAQLRVLKRLNDLLQEEAPGAGEDAP